MTFMTTGILIALVNMAIGGSVYLTNPQRGQNRQLFILSLLLSVWTIWLFLGYSATTEYRYAFCIRIACYIVALTPFAFHLLFLSVENPNYRFLELLIQAKYSLIVSQCIGAMCFTDLLLVDVIMPGPLSSHKYPEAVPGIGYPVYNAYYPITFGFIIFYCSRRFRRFSGIQRTEFNFVLLGMALFVFLILLICLVIPSLTGKNQAQMYGPISIIALDGVLAYGIATERIMGVEHILRRAMSYALVTGYLILLYTGIWWVTNLGLAYFLQIHQSTIPHLIGALVMAFSMAPAHGTIQRFSDQLFISRQSLDVRRTVSEVNKMLQAISTMPQLLKTFSETVAKAIQTDSIELWLLSENGYEQKFPEKDKGFSEQAISQIPLDDVLVRELKSQRAPLIGYELQRRRPTEKNLSLTQRLTDLHAIQAVGIRSSHQLEGILLIGQKITRRIYSLEEIDTLQILCDQLAVALENAALYTQTQNSKIYNEILLDHLTTGVIGANAAGQISVINREAQRLTHLTPEQALDQPVEILPKTLGQALNVTIESGQGLKDQELLVTHNSNDDIPIRLSSSIFKGHTGNLLGALLVFNDLSDIKKLETQIRRTDRLSSIGTLSAGMAHEIKNPLVSIKTFTQLLPERYEDEDFRTTFSSLIGKEVTRIDTIVNQLLSFARPAKPILSPTHLHEVLNDTIQLVKQQLKNDGIILHYSAEAANDLMQADPNLLEQTVINFFLNAIDSMDEGGTLSVTTELIRGFSITGDPWQSGSSERRIRLNIKDTGVGIPPDDIKHIFDPFFTTKSHGTGLGLSVTHGIIHEHGGIIDVESELGVGTTFHIVFPLINEEVVA